MNVLVTGGAGFIGSHFVRQFYHAHPDALIVNLDLLTYAGNPTNLADLEELEKDMDIADKRYHFVRGDICDGPLLAKLIEKYPFDCIVNFAAETHVDRSLVNMSDFINTNIAGVRSLIEAIRAHKIPRFVHISTDEVYGTVPEGFSTEDAPLRPSNPYSASKAAGDLVLLAFIRTCALPAMIIRGSNNYGPYQYPEKLIPLTISNLIEGKKMPVHGTGEHVRSWLHVDDFCRAIDLVTQKGRLHEVYNVSTEEKTNMDILERIASHLGKDLASSLEHVRDRPGADTRYAPDASKIRSELGWAPERSVDQDLPRVVDWYLEHQDWWKSIKGKDEYIEHYEKQSKGQWY